MLTSLRREFDTVLVTRIAQFAIGGLLIGGVLALNLVIAYRTRPVFLPASRTDDPIARYRTVVSARVRLFGIGLPLVVALIAGLAAQGDWQTTQLFLHSTPFGVADPVFGKDVSFYAFRLPFYREILDWLFVTVTISFFGALISQYLFGGIRVAGRRVCSPSTHSTATAARLRVPSRCPQVWPGCATLATVEAASST